MTKHYNGKIFGVKYVWKGSPDHFKWHTVEANDKQSASEKVRKINSGWDDKDLIDILAVVEMEYRDGAYQPKKDFTMNEQEAVDKILEFLLHIDDASLLKGLIQEIWALIGQDLPKIVCLCGSTRFSQAYQDANLNETLAGRIVLTIGCDMRSDAELFTEFTEWQLEDTKQRLDELHLRKIDLADEILVLNVNGYVGESTRREVEYARATGKEIRWLSPEKLPL